jgi:hypothetical protein
MSAIVAHDVEPQGAPVGAPTAAAFLPVVRLRVGQVDGSCLQVVVPDPLPLLDRMPVKRFLGGVLSHLQTSIGW